MCFQIHQMVVGIASNWPKFTGFNAFALPFPCKSSRKIQFMHCISLYIPHHPYVLQVAWLRTLSDHTIPTGATPSYKGLMQKKSTKKNMCLFPFRWSLNRLLPTWISASILKISFLPCSIYRSLFQPCGLCVMFHACEFYTSQGMLLKGLCLADS